VFERTRRADVAVFCRNSGEVILPHWIVDALPGRLWTAGNLFIPRYGDSVLGHWHSCVGHSDEEHAGLRMVERNGHEVALGRRPFNFEAHGPDL
jgi:hypothetical protein